MISKLIKIIKLDWEYLIKILNSLNKNLMKLIKISSYRDWKIHKGNGIKKNIIIILNQFNLKKDVVGSKILKILKII